VQECCSDGNYFEKGWPSFAIWTAVKSGWAFTDAKPEMDPNVEGNDFWKEHVTYIHFTDMFSKA
jgi:hypothetical protein